MHWIDWAIVFSMVIATIAIACITRKYTRSVADFLAANRCAGRYVLGVNSSMLGAITVIASFEVFYNAGFTAAWWQMMQLPVGILIALTGWAIYRYRQTKAMTLAQFFELRYSRSFRIFCGILGYLTGILNYGIFPALNARFFIYFCGLPQQFPILGITVPMFPFLMATFLAVSLFMVFLGGQIAIILTDFFQGIFSNMVFVILIFYCLYKFDWSTILQGLSYAPEGKSMINPFKTGNIHDFNCVYFIVWTAELFFVFLAWQGRGGYNSAAKTPHEARMSKVMAAWRQLVSQTVVVILPIIVFVLLRHPKYSALAASIQSSIAAIPGSEIKDQMTVPIALAHIFPVGIMGLFCAMMFAAMITTDEPYLHAWGSILIQDVILPLRKKPLTPRQHIWILRLSILFVAAFIFTFSLLFNQTTHIMMYFGITGAIFLGGAGPVIICGLYWNKGTTSAAWTAMIASFILATAGLVISQMKPNFYLTGVDMYGLTILICLALYVLISLASRKHDFDMDRLLHRGKYAIAGETAEKSVYGFKALITKEFTRSDKRIYIAVIAWTLGWFGIFVVGTLYGLIFGLSDQWWAGFWKFYIYISLALGVVTTIWFSIGGMLDVKEILMLLAAIKRNPLDDGRVSEHQNLADSGENTTSEAGATAAKT
jgi:SSS family solute:Na+ symporter